MIKFETPPKGLPLIRSAFSSKYLQPTQWFYELQKHKPDEIIGLIEKYEFIIAILIKTISKKNILIDKSFIIKVNNICDNTEHYTREYFNNDDFYKPMLDIIRFIKFKDNMGKVFIDNEAINVCESWNKYYRFIFGESGNNDTESLSVKNINSNTTYNEFINNINFPEISYDGIYNLLVYFEDKKHNLKSKYVPSEYLVNNDRDNNTDKNAYINAKNYSDPQKKLLYYNDTYFQIMEVLQTEDLKNKLGYDEPIIINKNCCFFLTKNRNFFCDIVFNYCKKYNERYNPESEFHGVDWSFFDQCMKNKKNTKFNLIENKNTSTKNNKYNKEINDIVEYIFKYINSTEKTFLHPKSTQKSNRPPLINKN